MRILVQRIFESWVKVDGIDISRIKKGLLVLIGLTHDDTP
jgi:D-Tyr-tRNAtyr deacylase